MIDGLLQERRLAGPTRPAIARSAARQWQSISAPVSRSSFSILSLRALRAPEPRPCTAGYAASLAGIVGFRLLWPSLQNSISRSVENTAQRWSSTMLKKRLLTISLLLRLMAISTAAHAGSTITDKSYWPDEARQTAQSSSLSSQSNFNSALADEGSASSLQLATNDGGSTRRYQGGPKSP